MFRAVHKIFLIISLSLAIHVVSNAQDIKPVNSSVWTDVFFQQTVGEKLRYLIHSNYKFSINNGDYRQIMVRPALIHMAGDMIHFQGGFNFFYTWENDLGLSEFRTWQGMNVFFPRIRNVHINNFFRIEQRFFYDNQIELPNFLRGRYMISANVPINKRTMSPGAIYLWPSFELFADLAGADVDTFVTRERFSLGAGYAFSNSIRTEIVYMHERARDEMYDPFELENNVFRGIFRYSLPFRNN